MDVSPRPTTHPRPEAEPTFSSTKNPRLDSDLVRRLHRRADAGRWNLSEEAFGQALARSVKSRFGAEPSSGREVADYLESLHLEDLALACACARASEQAWEHFVRAWRPALMRAAASCAPGDLARELADSMYADLFGVTERDGERRSLFDYYHGRSTLGGWLRAVLAQRAVDHARAARRFEPLPEEDAGGWPATVQTREAPDLDRTRYLRLTRMALAGAIALLAPRERLRLAMYYAQQLKLAAVGRALGESEATTSRKLERTRRSLRCEVERRLREEARLGESEIVACFDAARTDPEFDLARSLPVPDPNR
jgi:RNA polymerase sigma-70 factor, ECF subfamily